MPTASAPEVFGFRKARRRGPRCGAGGRHVSPPGAPRQEGAALDQRGSGVARHFSMCRFAPFRILSANTTARRYASASSAPELISPQAARISLIRPELVADVPAFDIAGCCIASRNSFQNCSAPGDPTTSAPIVGTFPGCATAVNGRKATAAPTSARSSRRHIGLRVFWVRYHRTRTKQFPAVDFTRGDCFVAARLAITPRVGGVSAP